MFKPMQWRELFLGNVFPEYNIATSLGESSVALSSSPFFPLETKMTAEGGVALKTTSRKHKCWRWQHRKTGGISILQEGLWWHPGAAGPAWLLALNILLWVKNKVLTVEVTVGCIFYYLQSNACLTHTILFRRKHIANINQAFWFKVILIRIISLGYAL